MTVETAADVINGEVISGSLDDKCRSFSIDSRKIEPGQVYIALPGEKFNGNDFVEDAIKNGAQTCIISCDYKDKIKDPEILKLIRQNRVNIIKVKNTVRALQQLATYKRDIYSIPVVAITGSVGKTSTKDMIASVLSQKYNVLKTQGNMNNEIGLPLTILSLKDETALVVEMGMNHAGEIRKLTKIARPTIAVITNIGTAHIGNLGSRENILKAKLEILEGLQGRDVVINNDDDLLCEWGKKMSMDPSYRYHIITYGIKNEDSIYVANHLELSENRSDFSYQNRHFVVPIGGEHFVMNALCALAVGRACHLSLNKITDGIREAKVTGGRMEVEKGLNGAEIINDSYNANYDSMSAAIKYLSKLEGKRKIAVLGDMKELGDYSAELHKKVGEEIQNNIDVLITVGEEAKQIDSVAKAPEKFHFATNDEAIEKLKSIIGSEDVVLVKASNAMHFAQIVDALKAEK